MSTAGIIATAAVTGLIAGAASGAVALGLFGLRDKAAISATIELTNAGGTCAAKTSPPTIVVGNKDIVQWRVVGNCVPPNEVEVKVVGTCGALGAKTATAVPDLFEESPPHKGFKIKRTIKHNQDGCFAYQVVHGNIILEDPEIEIVQF